MWTCCWYCFCFSRKCWCCCWMTSWANMLWGSGADWVRFRGLWRGNLGRTLPEERSVMARGEGGCTDPALWPNGEKQYHLQQDETDTYWIQYHPQILCSNLLLMMHIQLSSNLNLPQRTVFYWIIYQKLQQKFYLKFIEISFFIHHCYCCDAISIQMITYIICY